MLKGSAATPNKPSKLRGSILRRHDDISSTERLLELIRREDTTEAERPEAVSPSKAPKSRKPHLVKLWPLKKTITVGVDIGEKDLKLVKVTQPSDQRRELLDFTSVSLEPHIPKDSPEFSQLLRAALSDFCGPADQCELWTIMSSALVEMRDIRIPPKVPRKQIFNAVYWTLKKEIPFNEKESIFNFEVIGDIVEKGGNKTAVRVYTAPREEVNQLRNLFANAGYTLAGISIAPFAVQNLLRAQWMEISEATVASLYVGTARSRIDIFSYGNVVFTRVIKTGMNSLIEGILEGLKKAQGENGFQLTQEEGSPHLTMRDGEAPMAFEHARKILFSLAPDFPSLSEDDPGFSLKEEDIFSMILTALERIVRQIERSFEHYSLTLGNDSVSKLYIGGEINHLKKLVGFVQEQMGLPIDIIDPFAPGNPSLGKLTPPGSISERASYVPSVGMALSSNPHTPNFIFTYKDRENAARVSRLNRSVFGAFVCMVAICMAVFWWQGGIEAAKKSKINGLRQKLAEYNPRTEQNLIVLMTAKAKMKKKMLREYSKRYQAMTAIGELSQRTPSHIRLLDITARLGQADHAEGKGAAKILTLEGLVFGERQSLEASLAAYLMTLASCPVFREPSISKSSIESREGKEVLHFTTHLELV